MSQRVKLVAAVVGGLALAGTVVVITASAVGLNFTATPQSAARPSESPIPTVSPSTRTGQANPTVRFVNTAVIRAEAQVLGVTARDLQVSFRQGTTLHQLADRKGISQAAFQAAFEKNLTGLLDQGVTQGQLTVAQEQQALTRLSRTVPNWDQAPAMARPQASPSASPR